MTTTYLITGANRGLGQALTSHYLAQPNSLVIAAVRDPTSTSSGALAKLPKHDSSGLITVKINALSDTNAHDAVAQLQSNHNVTKLDVVIANAGYGTVYGDLAAVQTDEVKNLFDINAVGPLRLFQATRGLLQASSNPRFVLMGTPIGSIGAMEKAPWPMFAYGASKAAAHYLTRKIHCEAQSITAFVVDPGFMQTDMGNTGARHFGYDQAFVPVEVSRAFVVEQIARATKEETSGKFLTFDESRAPYIEW